MRRWWRNPGVHFVLIGALLFTFTTLLPTLDGKHPGESTRTPIVISAEQVRQLRLDYTRQAGAEPTSGALQAMLRQVIDDEILYREARRLALDLGDRSIRKRLIQKMRAVSTTPRQNEDALYREALSLGLDEDLVIQRLLREKMRMLLRRLPNGIQIRKQDVTDYIERHRDQFLRPDTISFSHVFLSGQPQDAQFEKKAKRLLAKLRARSMPPETAATHSDAFLLGQRFQAQTRIQVMRHFGADFTDEVFSLAPRAWSAPIASPYGLHLVWVQEKEHGKLPPAEEIWTQASRAWLEERSAENLATGLQRLRERYEVRIEGNLSAAEPIFSAEGN